MTAQVPSTIARDAAVLMRSGRVAMTLTLIERPPAAIEDALEHPRDASYLEGRVAAGTLALPSPRWRRSREAPTWHMPPRRVAPSIDASPRRWPATASPALPMHRCPLGSAERTHDR